MAEVSFYGPETYSQAETPDPRQITDNGDGSETVIFHVIPGSDYTYTVTITDASNDVHIHEASTETDTSFPGNDYYGTLTGYSNGGDFTVQNYTEGAGVSNEFVWLFTSAPENSGSIILYQGDQGGPYVPPVCFAEGSRILTDRGEIAVENLAIGDLVTTTSGERRPIRWLGHRTIDCTRQAEPRSVWPVRVSAHAFGENRPNRDLLVSPGHALCVTCVDEVLILADRLLNGANIVQQKVERITYWHIELDSHDILIANGMPAESYLDMGNRGFFMESDPIDLHARPDGLDLTRHDRCRPFVNSGPLLDVVRHQLVARAERMGWTRSSSFDCHVMVDGRKHKPRRAGNSLIVQLPSTSRNVRLVSDSFVANDLDGKGDRRMLGLNLQRLSISDASERRIVPIDDERLDTGFHPAEREAEKLWRWTSGEALLPPSLWEGLSGPIEIRIDGACPSLRGWKRLAQPVARQPPQRLAG